MPLIAALDIADAPPVWTGLGFTVDGGVAWADGVAHRLGCDGKGIVGWSLAGVTLPPGAEDLDGLPTTATAGEEPAGSGWGGEAATVTGSGSEASGATHPNGVIGLDHVVVATPDHGRSIAALEAAGLVLRRNRETGSYGAPMLQGFFRLGPVILEVIGPVEPSGDGPAGFFGLAWTCASLDATGSWLGSRLHAPKDAVQAGRRIATLDRHAGSRVAMAFMSPVPAGSPQ